MRITLAGICTALLLSMTQVVELRGHVIARYRPSASQTELEAQCRAALPAQGLNSPFLIRYFIVDENVTDILETNAPNLDNFTENCAAIIPGNSTVDSATSDNVTESTRSVLRVKDVEGDARCYDVLFFDGGNPIICGYLSQLDIDYEPVTDEERRIERECKENFPLPPYASRSSLIRFVARPTNGAFVEFIAFNTFLPNENPYTEDCNEAFTYLDPNVNDTEREVLRYSVSRTCHDVLFHANGTSDPVSCLFINEGGSLHALISNVYTPSTPDEEEKLKVCENDLPELNRHQAVLRRYTLSDSTRWALQTTDAPNDNSYNENCSDISVSGTGLPTREVLVVDVTGTDGVVRDYCMDVLFLANGTSDPVTCYYKQLIAGPLVVGYDPQTPEEEKFEVDCKENLVHPNDTTVHLVQYAADPPGQFPGFIRRNVEYNNTRDSFQEECTEFFLASPLLPETSDSRAVIYLLASQTCHDVLFFVNSTNPVVCLFAYNFPTTSTGTSTPIVPRIVVHTLVGIVSLVFLSLSVVASLFALVTHIIFPSLLTLPTKVIMNLVTTFLLGDIVSIIQNSLVLDDPYQNEIYEPFFIIAYYFFYARFVWMALSGFEMCRTIHVGTQLRFNSAAKRNKFLITYLAIGWTLPLIPTIIMTIVHYEQLEKDLNYDYNGSLFGIGGVVIVIVPVAIVAFFNVGTLIYLTYILHMARQWQVKVTEAIAAKKRKTNFARIFIIILSLLGITWITLFVVHIDAARSDGVLVTSTILNAIQPIFVCISFVCTKKIYRKYKTLIFGRKEPDIGTETSQNNRYSRFKNRKLISFLFTDKELTDMMGKARFGRQRRMDSKISNASLYTQDSSLSLGPPPVSNGVSTPPKFPPSLDPITEELETAEMEEESPTHVTVDLKDSTL